VPGLPAGGLRRPLTSTLSVVVTISEATTVDDGLLAAVAGLVAQLSRSAPAPGPGELAEIIESPATTFFVAHGADGGLVGILTLAVFRIPTGVRAWIEDVVVDESARGQGVGEALTDAALQVAAAAGARTVELTSRPSREAANRLYLRLGFARRDTNVYRIELGEPSVGTA
jgi:ribosomal protein S18 acetylase RimI-like enzyme